MIIPYFMETADGYLKVDPWEQLLVFVACMPWGKPFSICATEEGAEHACKIARETPEMKKWYEQNEEMGVDWYGDFSVVTLHIPSLATLTTINGETVKSTQVYQLPLSERGVRTNSDYNKWEGLDDNPSDNRPDID